MDNELDIKDYPVRSKTQKTAKVDERRKKT